MKFIEFSEFLKKLEETSKRNDLTIILADFFAKVDPDEAPYAMYMMQGRLAPKFVNLEFNFSKKLILKSFEKIIAESQISVDIMDIYKSSGDLGSVAEVIMLKIQELKLKEALVSKFKSADSKEQSMLIPENQIAVIISDKISDIYFNLERIAKAAGKGSVESKINSFILTLLSLDPLSARFVTRIVSGDLRLGVSDKTVLDALSWYVKGDKSLREILDYAFGANSDIGELAKLVISTSKDQIETKLADIELQIGKPVASKLVEREADPASVWKRMPNCFVQPKLDGLRGQLHYSKTGGSQIFSRNMENMTDQFPELLYSLKNLEVDSIILDSEIIGFNEEANSYLSYQETMQRKRKYDIDLFSGSIPVRAMCFDILYLNGQDLSSVILEKRLDLLSSILSNSSSALRMLETKQCNSEAELNQYFTEKVEAGLEGIICKAPGTTYEPGSRNFKWIKLKANTRSDLVDTLDVAVIGYYIGTGQRSKFGIGALLTAVYEEKEDKYYSVGKVGSGLTDEILEKIAIALKAEEVSEAQQNYVVNSQLKPDVWVRPKYIIEIIADEITRSPAHTAAMGIPTSVKGDKSDRGLSVRFPRIKIWDRDKDYPNTVKELVRMYELRKGK